MDSQRLHWHTGTNQPGCLPDTTEPATTHLSWHSAQVALQDELASEADLAYGPDGAFDNAAALDEAARQVGNAAPPCEFSLVLGDSTGTTRAWWLERCDRADCEATS